MTSSAEKLVKYTIKKITGSFDLDYSQVKLLTKKVVKTAKNFDESLLGMMEDLMDLGNVGSEEELKDFDIDVLKLYCKIKSLDDTLSDRKIVASVWKNLQEEFEMDSDDSENDSEDESVVSSDESGSDEEESPEPVIISKKGPTVEFTEDGSSELTVDSPKKKSKKRN